MRAGNLLAFAFMALAGCESQQASAPELAPAHSVLELMTVIMEPQAEVFWNSTGTIMDATGEHDMTPTTDEGWLATQSAAATVTEMGNLLQMPIYTEGRGADWTEFSKSLVQIGQKAEQAVVARDTEAMMDTGLTVYNVCNACHRVYLPQAATEAPQS